MTDKNTNATPILFATTDRPQGIETLADRYTISLAPGDGRIPWRQLQQVAADPANRLTILSGMRTSRRCAHPLVDEWNQQRESMTKLETRIAGKAIESLAWQEFSQEREMTEDDVIATWKRLDETEPAWRKERFGAVSLIHDAHFWGMLRQAGHQAYYMLVNGIGLPQSYTDYMGDRFEQQTGWQVAVDLSGVSSRCRGGVLDAICCGRHSEQIVAVDIKAANHSIVYRDGDRYWNPKNQIQLLLYIAAIALLHVVDETCDISQPTALAFVNPIRGTIEFATADVLLDNMPVILNLARRSFALDDETTRRLGTYLSNVLDYWLHVS